MPSGMVPVTVKSLVFGGQGAAKAEDAARGD